MAEPSELSRVFLRDLEIEADIGCYAEERGVMQPLLVTVELTLSCRRFAEEALHGTVDYTVLAAKAKALGATHIDLIETFAERLAATCLGLPSVDSVRVEVRKPRAVPNAMAGVEIVRRAAIASRS
jgi:7,8-dihydroneopterin aldolase/epimerase/oxygenase